MRAVTVTVALIMWCGYCLAAPEPTPPPAPAEATVAPPPVSESAAPTEPPAPVPAPVQSVAAPQATPTVCVPECRNGFQCVSGTCVSNCNPPCNGGTTCTAERQCVLDIQGALKAAQEKQMAEAKARSARNHDGMYLRAGLNFGFSTDTARRGAFETTSHGFAWGFDYALGFNAGPIVIGFDTLIIGGSSPSIKQNGKKLGDASSLYTLVGLLVDVYPDTHGGLHFMGVIGTSNADINVRDQEDTSNGFGMLLGAGYDAWISREWSLGLMGRVLYTGGATDDFGNHHAWVPMLTTSALWN